MLKSEDGLEVSREKTQRVLVLTPAYDNTAVAEMKLCSGGLDGELIFAFGHRMYHQGLERVR